MNVIIYRSYRWTAKKMIAKNVREKWLRELCVFWTEHLQPDCIIQLCVTDNVNKLEKNEIDISTWSLYVESGDWRYSISNNAHEFYTFSMGARLSIVASAPFVHFAFITHLHVYTDATYLNISITYAYTGILYVCRKCIFRGARDAIKSGLALCKISEHKCGCATHNIILLP